MENKHLTHTTVSNKVQHMQDPKYYNQYPNYNQGQQSVVHHQYQGGHNSLSNREVQRRVDQQDKEYVHYPQRHSSLNPPFPTTGITFSTHSSSTASAGFQPSYQDRHQDQVTNLQKLQTPGGYGAVEGGGGRGGLHTYPPRNEPKQRFASDYLVNGGQGQIHSLDRYEYPQKSQTLVNQQQIGRQHGQDYNNSLLRQGVSQSQTAFPTSVDSHAKPHAATVYTKYDGDAHKNTDSHIKAPSVQTNAYLRGEPQYTQPTGSQNNAPQQLGSRSSAGLSSGIITPVSESGSINSQGLRTQSRDSRDGSGGRIGSPVSVKVGSQGGSVSGDSDTGQCTNFPRTSTQGNYAPVIHNFPIVYSSTSVSPVSSTVTSAGSNNSATDSQKILPFNTELSPQKPTGDQNFDNWAFANFHHNMMASANDQMKAMEENMKRMQKHMEEQFKNFDMNNPPAIAPPEGFPQLMEPSKIMPPPNVGIKGINEPLIPGIQTPVPNFTSQPLGFTAITGVPPSGQSTPSSTMTSRSSTGGLPAVTFHPGMDTMELNRCIQNTPDGKKQLQLKFDMQDFKPEEVSVKKDKNRLEVHAHHEEKEPNRVACKVFHQQYHLPKNVRLAKMEYAMDPEGTLTVKSPVKPRHNVKFEEGQKLEQTKLIHPQK